MAYLTLEDGTIFKGDSFGKQADIMGEVVFNTGMTGYQEVLTDPSYCGQIVTMTYPLIGNYGIDETVSESCGPQVRAFVMREKCSEPSNWNCKMSLEEYLVQNEIIGLAGIDTRELTRKLRDKGTMHGIITQVPPSSMQIEEMKNYTVKLPVEQVTCKEKYHYSDGSRNVAVLDFGLKRNILRSLEKRDCALTVFPALTDPREILQGDFDGLMLTNGPGNPKDNVRIIENLTQLIGKLPIFGICLGHQLVALAMGADTEKLKYGHRGSNHPVKDMQRNKVYITSQNHGYTIMSRSLPACAVVSHKNWNDQTIEGVKYIGYPMFTVQFHPEAAPGPEDTAYLFDDFIEIIDREKAKHGK
ncbi:carbamoyl-phosphate synthase small chain [Christensenellaceae bacterium]|nr:carbamoyl-phosphate synthase small chain [Christensenellaceae bacterium]BDF60822.1 carbamoyl-phosphate synthase small chain [Christensenellaceae bacterium]